MASILIVQEEPSPYEALKTVLSGRHKLTIIGSTEKAVAFLHREQVDLIISRVHLQRGSVFDFIRQVKMDPVLHDIPFVCFSGKISSYARKLDPVMSKIGEFYGVDLYIRLEDFCDGESCQYEDLRKTIESCLTAT